MVVYLNLKKSVLKIFVLFLLLLFVMPTLMVTGNESNRMLDNIEFPLLDYCSETRSASREEAGNFTNMSSFTDGVFDNTEMDADGDVSLTWDLPQSPYENDGSAMLLNHFENSLIGNDDEVPTSYTRSTYGLTGLWELNEGYGTTAYDSSGNNNHGTLLNGPTWTTDAMDDFALSFDGAGDMIDCGNGASINFQTQN